MVIFKTLNIRQWRESSLRERKQMSWAQRLAQLTALKAFQATAWWLKQWTLWFEEMKQSVLGTKTARVHRAEPRRGTNCTEREFWRSAKAPPESSAQRWSTYAYENYHRPGKEPPKGLGGTVPCDHIGFTIVSPPTSHIGKSSNSWATGLNIQKSLASVLGSNYL